MVFPGGAQPVTTFHVPGFDHDSAGTVHGTCTDPAGQLVDFVGVRTQPSHHHPWRRVHDSSTPLIASMTTRMIPSCR